MNISTKKSFPNSGLNILSIRRKNTSLLTQFRFSNYVIKPMIGVIRGYQIVIVQLYPDVNTDKGFIECWGVQLNGRVQNCLYFYLKCYSSYPSILVGINNNVQFDSVQPKCMESIQVGIKNTSVHSIE